MSLGKKTLALFLALGLAICAGSYLALRVAVLPAFEEFERQTASDALVRIDSLLEGELRALEVINLEYSAWDDTVEYVESRSHEFEQDNLSPGYWQSIDMHMVMVFDAGGQLVYGWIVDPSNGEEMPLDQELREPLPGEEDSGAQPHRHHREVHQPRDPLDRPRPGREEDAEGGERERPR